MERTEAGQRASRERFERISEELIHRIRPVCQDMPEEMLLALVESMASIQLKYELRDDLTR